MRGDAVSLEQSVRPNSLQNASIREDHGPSRNTRILDRTQEVAGSSPASSIGRCKKYNERPKISDGCRIARLQG
jgi:hypothetical protein